MRRLFIEALEMLNSASVSASRSAPRSDLRSEEFGSKSEKKEKNTASLFGVFQAEACRRTRRRTE